jgi:phosphate/sulfate permease
MGLLRGLLSSERVLFQPPNGETPPPGWIRTILIGTCSLVSFSHGSNDGQKGIGLMMLVLVGIIPAQFAIDSRYSNDDIHKRVFELQGKVVEAKRSTQSIHVNHAIEEIEEPLNALVQCTQGLSATGEPSINRFEVRRQILLLRSAVKKAKAEQANDIKEIKPLLSDLDGLKKFTDHAPFWVIVVIALSIGIGTMIGWKRIVVTIGEKIGKTHLTYAQGASAEIVAASTIGVSTYLGLPVSTTHVLSSGIAGTMFASGGKENLQKSMITKILLAWILTFPVCLTMSGTLFLLFRYLSN